MARLGRPGMLTEHLTEAIASIIESGVSAKVAAVKVGISVDAYYKWRRRGEREVRRMESIGAKEPMEGEEIYVNFFYRITQAGAEATAVYEKAVADAVKGSQSREPDARIALAWLEKSPTSPWNAFARARNSTGRATVATLEAGGLTQDLTPEQQRQFAKKMALDEKAMAAAMYLQDLIDQVLEEEEARQQAREES